MCVFVCFRPSALLLRSARSALAYLALLCLFLQCLSLCYFLLSIFCLLVSSHSSSFLPSILFSCSLTTDFAYLMHCLVGQCILWLFLCSLCFVLSLLTFPHFFFLLPLCALMFCWEWVSLSCPFTLPRVPMPFPAVLCLPALTLPSFALSRYLCLVSSYLSPLLPNFFPLTCLS